MIHYRVYVGSQRSRSSADRVPASGAGGVGSIPTGNTWYFWAVCTAVERGAISPERYESYRRLRAELEAEYIY